MNRLPICTLAAVALVVAGAANDARAQVFVSTFHPVVPVTSFYAPTQTVAFAPAPVVQTVASPVVQTVASPVVQTVASPVVQSVAMPVIQTVASPVVVQPAVVAAPAVPVVTYFRAPTVAWQPVAQVHTRFRPILGGTVSRVRYSYAPVVIP